MARIRRAASAALVLLVMLGTVALGAAPVGRPAAAAVPPRVLTAVAWPPSSSLLVAEVVTGAASASDEYVELTNASAATIDLGGLELVYVTATGTTVTRKATWSSPSPLEPGRHLLVANAGGTFAGLADATYSGGFAATGGALAIRQIGGTAIDAIGWGDATNAFVEGTVAPAPPAGSSLERRPGGSAGNVLDTNDNAADFAILASPVPQSLISLPLPSPTPTTSPTPTLSPTPTPGPTPTPSPTPTQSPTSTSSPGPTATASPLATSTPMPTPTAVPTPTPSPAPTPSPTPTLTPTPTPQPTPTPVPTPTATLVIAIAAARAMPDGAAATVEGVVTVGLGALESGRAGFVQDASGGIAVYLEAPATSVVAAGTLVRMTGSLDDRYAQRTLRVAIVDLVDLGPAVIPDPMGALTGTAAESIEGVRVVVVGTVTEAPTTFADGLGLLIDDGSGPLRAIVGPPAQGLLDPHRGDLVRVVGPIGQRDSSGSGASGYRLHAMNEGELVLVATPTPTPGATAAPTATPALPSPTASSSPTPMPLPTPSAGPTPTPTPTATPTAPTPAPAAPSIATVRSMPIGSSVSVEGTVTAEPGRPGSPALLALGDASGGIFVRLPDGVARPARGDRLVVTGKLADPYGQLEIRTTVGGIVPTGNPAGLPAPLAIDSADLGETTEGRLATLTGSVEHAPAKSAGGLALWVLDDAGDRARVLVAGPSGIVTSDLLAGHRYRLTGIVGQRASRTGALDGYRLWLRDRSDIVHVASPTPTSSPAPSPSPGPGTPPSVSIARALTLQGRSVSVIGVAIVPVSLLDASGRRIVIQDGSAAIEVLLPTGARPPAPGHRLRVVGQVGRAYDAPRIRAKTVADLGATAMPAPRSLSGAPTLGVEWRLVRIVGTVADVRKLGERWRAEVRVGSSRVVVSGMPGARIVSTALIEGRRATIVGIVRRAYPGAADRRFAVVPRSPADIALSGSSSVGGSGTAATGGGTSSPAPSRDPRDRGVGADPAGSPLTASVELSRLGEHIGQRVRVGGLVVDLVGDGFTLDDGSATGRIVLAGEAAAFLGLIEPGDAVELAGNVETDADGGARLVVEAPADLLRVGALGASTDPAGSNPNPAATDSTSTGTGGSSGSTARAAGLGGLPDPTVAGAGWLALVVGLSMTVMLVRRRRARRGLSARIAARLAALSGPPPVP